jgi:uncharacterized protein (DUF2141 family)
MFERRTVPLRRCLGRRLKNSGSWIGVAGLVFCVSLDAAPNAPVAAGAVGSCSLTLEVSGLRNNRGNLAIALFDSAATFPDHKQARHAALVRSSQKPVKVVFSGLKPGKYAAAVLHDENQNNQMDFNFLGMPLEGYGFSNDAPVLFGPPSFAAAAVTLSPKPTRAPIKLRYFGL